MKLRARWRLGLARALLPHLRPDGSLVVLGLDSLAQALVAIGRPNSTAVEQESVDQVLACRPNPALLQACAGMLRQGGRLLVMDWGTSQPPPQQRTWALCREGFIEVGQLRMGRFQLTFGERLRLPD